ncbi:MAG: hypothetical protein HY927_01065 [Elusimicrobia bacterium]|nr:hypothetical protein [Elusimicrobiota bacterium]
MPGPRVILKAYGWLFLAVGASFVALTGSVMGIVNLGAGLLPGARVLPGEGKTLWLGLTGSMMTMISYLSFSLASDPRQGHAWRALLLSKGVSTGLFLAFAVLERNPLFVLAAAVDGAILLHLGLLSRGFAGPPDLWSPRTGESPDCLHEAWFIKANDPKTRDALWLRYTLERRPTGLEGGLWYAVFDARERKTVCGRWTAAGPGVFGGGETVCRIAQGVLRRDGADCDGDEVSWRLRWSKPEAPPFRFVPDALHLWGLAGTVYASALPLACFDGEIRVGDRAYGFTRAPGSVGHLWGRRKAECWRWAHAVMDDPSGDGLSQGGQAVAGAGRSPLAGDGTAVFEILSARGRLGPLVLPRVTVAHLWRKGRHHASVGLTMGLRNATWPTGGGWGFRVDFGDFVAEGGCAPAPGMTAAFDYDDADGRVLRCANSKVGSLRLRLSSKDGGATEDLGTSDAAAVESVERG